MGVLANISGSWALDKGMLTAYIEGVYTSPYLYLNKKGRTTPSGWVSDWNYDLIVGYDITGGPELSYSGYTHGPDSIVCAIGTTYEVFQSWSLSAQILYKAHGQQGIAWYASQNQELNPGESHMNDISPTGIIEHTLRTVIQGSWKVTNGIVLTSTCGLIQRWNFRNISGMNKFEIQLAIGCTIDPLAIFI